MWKKILCGVLFVLLSACSSNDEELQNVDYGRYPEIYEKTVKSYMRHNMKFPNSAKYRHIGGPTPSGLEFGAENVGYVVCYDINQKTIFGKYAGYKRYLFVIYDGQIVFRQTDDTWGGSDCEIFFG